MRNRYRGPRCQQRDSKGRQCLLEHGHERFSHPVRRKCVHQHISVKGSDERGVESVSCIDCGIPLTRRLTGTGGYDYFPAEYHGA